MANFNQVNEYRRVRNNGTFVVDPTGDDVYVNTDKVTWIYQAGISSDEHNVFTVHLVGAPSFITDWNGIENIGDWVRVKEYQKIKQEDGSVIRQYTDHGIRVNPNNVAKWLPIGTVYGTDPNDEYDGYRVWLSDDSSFVTDQNGVDDIYGY